MQEETEIINSFIQNYMKILKIQYDEQYMFVNLNIENDLLSEINKIIDEVMQFKEHNINKSFDYEIDMELRSLFKKI